VQSAEDRQGSGETQIAQGYDFVEAAGAGDVVFGSPQGDEDNQDAGSAHRDDRPGDFEEHGENGCVHVDGKHKVALLDLALPWARLGST